MMLALRRLPSIRSFGRPSITRPATVKQWA